MDIDEINKLCTNVYKNMNNNYRNNLNQWCLKKVDPIFKKILNRQLSDKPFLDIMLLSYNEIEKLSESPLIKNLDYNYSIKSNKKLKSKTAVSVKDYLINNVYNAISKDSNRKSILSITRLSVCPYCNRNFMNSSNNKNTCELDHFWHKSQFPIFAASFFNLIPSCPSCNRNKGTHPFSLSPYKNEISSDSRITFSWKPLEGDFLFNHNSIYITSKTHKDFKKDFDLLDLHNLYQIHSDLVLDAILKKIFIPEHYLNEINNIIPLSDSDINRLFTGVYTAEKDYYRRPLSKLISDIYVELNYLER
ncbi:TPA: HNH endonuclease [Streptococcus suis]|nr:HNH endonuclease [Streptococcus suis]HEM5057821.1 HNH endonuclease [Streptococcus suis]HEM5068477.1 HNH endonuclease [Streptococcus suis]HEM5165695.1 HNH endonuclease [Streptococcus suis]